MTHEEALQGLQEARQRESEALEQLRQAERSHQLAEDATREAWLAVQDTKRQERKQV